MNYARQGALYFFLLLIPVIGVSTILFVNPSHDQAAAANSLPSTTIFCASTTNGFLLRWDQVTSPIAGYEIQYASNKNFKEKNTVLVTKSTQTSKLVKNLDTDTKYYVRLRTFQATNGTTVYSPYSNTVSLETPGKHAFLYKEGFYTDHISDSIQKRMTGKSYQKNQNIQLSDLRYVRVQHYGYDGKIKSGELVVNKKIAKKVVKLFYELYQEEYPIQRMKLIDSYDADDVTSMEANNTSAFNYRTVSGTSKLSNHAYGMAIDINPRINPYVKGNVVLPENGAAYKQRNVAKCKGKYKSNMIHKGDTAYQILTKYGFEWGGSWHSCQDYQHFEYTKN